MASELPRKILDFIRRFVAERGYPPSVRDIQEGVGVSSTSVVKYNLNKLEKEGYLTQDKKVSRGIRLVKRVRPRLAASPLDVLRIPLLGRIAAGEPILIPPTDFSLMGDEAILLTRDILKEEQGLYALQVRGDSMIDALIHDGDLVVMKYTREARNGEMVAVWLKEPGETTLKRFYLEEGWVRLQPANPTMQPIYVDPRNVEIRGKVVAVIRRLN